MYVHGFVFFHQPNSQQPTTQAGFNFHAALQNPGNAIFNTNMGSGSSAANSTLFTDQPLALNTNQADNASGMEISNPATGEPQHLPSLTAPTGVQGLQLQFGSTNPSQPFIFNQQSTNQQNQSTNLFENTSNMFGTNPPVLGSNLPPNMVFSATPAISNRLIKKARRRVSQRP